MTLDNRAERPTRSWGFVFKQMPEDLDQRAALVQRIFNYRFEGMVEGNLINLSNGSAIAFGAVVSEKPTISDDKKSQEDIETEAMIASHLESAEPTASRYLARSPQNPRA